jgi:polysaccharide biosynthesis protein PelA
MMLANVMKFAVVAILLTSAGFSAVASAAETPLPRTIYTFYDAKQETIPRYTLVHRALEMPLNWLGYHLEYIEREDALPTWREDIAGVVLWLPAGTAMPDQKAFVAWLHQGLDAHKKLIVMGNTGFDAAWRDTPEGAKEINSVLHRIGLRDTATWVELTYTSQITKKDIAMVGFERKYAGILPSYYSVNVIEASGAISHLSATDEGESGSPVKSDLIVTHKNGGYIAEGYGFYYELDATGEEILAQRWMVNPFRFLSAIFHSDDMPKPDVSTLNGRRIFYSHMDGDGWNNLAEMTKYARDKVIAAEVLFKEVYEPYNQLPFTVAPIVAELNTECYGLKQSAEVARQIFALPNVEPASHTYSHPLLWRYFEDGNAGKEERYLKHYPKRPNESSSVYDALSGLAGDDSVAEKGWKKALASDHSQGHAHAHGEQKKLDKLVKDHFHTPRSYACEPYDLEKEVKGAADYLQALAPQGKTISLLQWSGDTTPPENALKEVRENQMLNINGGDSRFDPEYPSYSYVAPIGLKVGKERQIYSSNSNENTYTNLWSDRFFGFRHLVNTVKNTESPYRVSPFNIYYHSYSGAKQASLEALKQNIGYALSQEIAPIFASDYARIAEGYFSAELIPLQKNRWKISNRGALQTIRFDHATLKTVDWEHSEGVIGMRHYQGSLYVALDPKYAQPIIAISPVALSHMSDWVNPLPSAKPYLIQSHWMIDSMQRSDRGVRMEAHGFGRGVMQLYWPFGKKVRLKVSNDEKRLLNQLVNAKEDGMLSLAIHVNAETPVVIELEEEPDA